MSKYKRYFMGLLGLVLAGLVTSVVLASGAGSKIWSFMQGILKKPDSGSNGSDNTAPPAF